MKLTIFGTEIYISFFFVAGLTLLLFCDKSGLAVPTFLAFILHEIGHLFAMWLFDCPPRSVRLIPASVQITESITHSYRSDIVIAVMGPAVNFVLFAVFYINYLVFHNQWVLTFSLLNLIIGLFNSLPVAGLDGGTVLFSLIAKKNYRRAQITLMIVTLTAAASALAAAVTLTVRGKANASLYIVALYLFLGVMAKRS